MQHNHGGAVCLSSFLIGGLMGAAVALLTAPRSGRQTRKMVGNKMRESTDYARGMATRAVEQGQESLDQASQYVRDQAGAAANAVRSAASSVRDAASSLQSAAVSYLER
jgi:gas vesicle protein